MILPCLLSLSSLGLSVIAEPAGLNVHTQEGEVVGTQFSPTVRRFAGIPYATAKRWEAPKFSPHYSQPFKATQFGHTCPQLNERGIFEFAQLAGDTDANRTIVESEDCLTLNIWAPSINRQQNTSVMIWTYGGDFADGTSDSSIYDGSTWVTDYDDVVVVTFNYRLNILGQPNAPQLATLDHSQNFGLLDMDIAIQWIYENIGAFGGDPERMILFGQSAGGVATDAYTFINPADHRIKGVIDQSGSLSVPVTGAVLGYNGTDPTLWNNVADAVGCGNNTDNAQLACMKGKSFTELTDASRNTSTTFHPVADGKTIFADTRARAAAGNFSRVPVLIGNTAQEGDIYSTLLQNLGLGHTIPVLVELSADITTQVLFACPIAESANDKVGKVPVWRYHYAGKYLDVFLFHVVQILSAAVFPHTISLYPTLRAFHGSDLRIIWGTYPQFASETEIAFAKYIRGAWVAFARDPVNGLSDYGWPQYQGPNSTTIIQLGGFYNATGMSLLRGDLLDFTCNATDTLLKVQTALSALVPGGGF